MIPEAPFLFSMAALNASLAGLAGLVAGLRRGPDLRPADQIHLFEIVEFAFANVLLAVSVVPLSLSLGDTGNGVRIGAGLALAYITVSSITLNRRMRRAEIRWVGSWAIPFTTLTVLGFLGGAAVLVSGRTDAYEGLLVVMLARPMLVFLLVLTSSDAH